MIVEGELTAEGEFEAVGCSAVEQRDAGDQWGCGLLVAEIVWIAVWLCIRKYIVNCLHCGTT